jgi:galactonate dehydratase
MHAIELANALAQFEPYWFEEPCQSENVEALAEIRRRSPIPIVTGETLLTRAGFRPVLRARAVDIINPDISNCGGILELMYIAAAAESEAIAVSPHNYNSTTLALSATVHASACLPNFIITEYFLPFEELGQRLCPNALRPVEGYIALPQGPGLGLEVDEAAVRAARGKQFPPEHSGRSTTRARNRVGRSALHLPDKTKLGSVLSVEAVRSTVQR